MIVLHQFPRVFGVLNPSPFCMKVGVYLRMAGLPHELRDADPRKAPRGKLPWIEDGGKVIADSGSILEYLRATYGDPLDGGLDAEARARGHAIRRLFEESLYWAMLYGRFIDPAGWAVTGPAFFGSFPWPLNAVVPKLARKHMAKELWFQGTGRHPPDQIYASGMADLAALAGLLGDRPYCLGDAATSVDATGYAFLANILVPPVETPLKRAAQGMANLVAYHDRMAAAWGTP